MEMIGILSAEKVQDCESTFHEDAVVSKRTTFKLVNFHDDSSYLEGESDWLNVQLRLPEPRLVSSSRRIQLHEVPFGLQSGHYLKLMSIGSGPALVDIRISSRKTEVNLEVDNTVVEIRSQESDNFKVFI